jgi:hypothetical protein
MMKAITLFIGSLIILSCKHKEQKEFTKDPSGLEYKLINENAGDTPKEGQYIKMQVRQVYNDSLLSDTRNRLPQYQKFDSTEMSKESYRIFSKVHVGDSLVFKVSSDSAFKTKKPAFVKGKGWLYTYVRVEAILNETEAQADLAVEKAKKNPQSINRREQE